MPTATDLVTDLPADFEVFGQAVATSMADLLGGTTGQILSKTTNADMDFTWTTPNPGDITGVTAGVGISGGGTSGDVTVTNSMATAMTTSGDLIQATGSGTFARLGTGTNGQFLTTNGTTNSWTAAPAGFATTVLSTTSLSGSSTTISGISGANYSALYLITTALQSTASNSNANITINGVTSGYVGNSSGFNWSANIKIGNLGTSASNVYLTILNVKATSGNKYFMLSNADYNGTTIYIGSGYLPQNAVVSSITINGSATLSGVMHLLGS